MKRFSLRDTLLLSAPILIVLTGLAYDKWQRRYETPQIALSIDFKSQSRTFGWETHLKGGPKPNYKVGWNEKIVAYTSRGQQIIWNHDKPTQGWMVRAIGGSEDFGGVSTRMATGVSRNNMTIYRQAELELRMLPIDTRRLEWQVEIAAIPSDNNEIWQSPLDSQTLANWSLVVGGAYLKRKFWMNYEPSKSETIIIKKTPLKQANHAELQLLIRRGNRRSFRRLVAFDGKTTRTLWTDADPLNGFCRSYGSGGGWSDYDGENLEFDFSKAKASWGEIVFLYDTVYDINNRVGTAKSANQFSDNKSLTAYEKLTGGIRFSKRLVLRSKTN